MKKEKKPLNFIQQERSYNHSILNSDIDRLHSAQRLMDEVASQIPPFSPEQIHALISRDRLSQFQTRRQSDRYQLTLYLLVLALAASILWHTAPAGLTPINITVLVLIIADGLMAFRTAYSLWLMRQTLSHRHCPYRMARYADRLNSLSHRRRWWINLVLRNSPNVAPKNGNRLLERLALRIPSYITAAFVLLILAFQTSVLFPTTHSHAKVTTTSNQTDEALCHTVTNIIEQS